MGEINRRKMEDRKEIIKIKEPISTANKFHSSELFYIEEAKLPFSAGIYTLAGCAMHWHHSWEILCQLEGEAYVRFGGRRLFQDQATSRSFLGKNHMKRKKLQSDIKYCCYSFKWNLFYPIFLWQRNINTFQVYY